MSELEMIEDEIVEEAEEESTRDALEAAFEEHDESEETTASPETETAASETMAAPTAPEGAQDEGSTNTEVNVEKPPASWSPVARETWANVPKEARDEIAKREQQTQSALQESAQARNFSNAFGDMAQRYTGFISANSGNPLQEVEGLLQTASIMQNGTQVQKAQMAADLIKNFSIDISTLDDVLVGQAPQEEVPDAVSQRLNQLEGYFKQQQQQQHAAVQQQQAVVAQEVNEFIATHEFAPDVRTTMADFMDIADRTGQPISLDEAYNRALVTRPDLQQIINNRATGSMNQNRVAGARRAAVSVPQNSGNGVGKGAPMSMRDALLDAWDGGS